MKLHEITPAQLECWRARLSVPPRMKNKLLVELQGIFRRAQKVYGLPRNPATEVERLRVRAKLDVEVFSPRRSSRSCGPRSPSRTPRSSHGGVHRAAARRAARAALARRRLRRLRAARPCVVRRGRAH